MKERDTLRLTQRQKEVIRQMQGGKRFSESINGNTYALLKRLMFMKLVDLDSHWHLTELGKTIRV